jgi:muconolactone delta-isomerase
MERIKSKQGEIIQHLLKREILRHLQEHGAINNNLLYVHFDRNRTADIQAVLQDLKQWNYIEVETDGMTRITTAGIRLLKDSNYWT